MSYGDGFQNGSMATTNGVPPVWPRIVLVLGAGGLRAAAHIGVVRALERLGVPIAEVIGTGTGAVVGAGVAAGHGFEELRRQFELLVAEGHFGASELKRRVRGHRYSIRDKGEHYRAHLRRHFPARAFAELQRPFFCNALSLSTGRTRYFGLPGAHRVAVADALYASSCLPGVFEPLELDGESWVDGGLAEALAIKLADTRPVDLILAIDLSRSDPHQVVPTPSDPVAVLARTYEILGSVLGEHALHRHAGRGDLILVQPDLSDVGLRGVGDLGEVIRRGEFEAIQTLLTHPKTRYFCDPDEVKAVDRLASASRDYVHLDVDMAACINCGVCAATCATEGYAAVPFGNVVRKLHHYECTRDGACERSCPTGAITLRHR